MTVRDQLVAHLSARREVQSMAAAQRLDALLSAAIVLAVGVVLLRAGGCV